MKAINNKTIVSTIIFITLSAFAYAGSKDVKTVEFKVEGVCGMCKERIENAALVKGVKSADWDKETKKIKVIFKTSKTTEEKIHKAIADSGHDTEKEKAKNEDYEKLPACCAYRDGVESH